MLLLPLDLDNLLLGSFHLAFLVLVLHIHFEVRFLLKFFVPFHFLHHEVVYKLLLVSFLVP